MNVIEMPLAELVAAPYNPRKGLRQGDPEYAKLRRSIEEFGLVDPVIWNRRTKRVVGGHQRLTVLRDLGHTTAPVVVVDLDEPREKALNLALNKIAGAWDLPLLKDLLLDLERSGGDQTLTGFDPKEIEEIITNYRDDDPGEAIPLPEPPADRDQWPSLVPVRLHPAGHRLRHQPERSADLVLGRVPGLRESAATHGAAGH